MPELPEVETIKLQLQKTVVGQTVLDVKVLIAKLFTGDAQTLIGTKILRARRFAKVMVLDFDNSSSVLVHLKMTGQLLYTPKDSQSVFSNKVIGGVPGKHTGVVLTLSRGTLYFNDYRRFGYVKVVPTASVDSSGFIGKLGPEWLKDLTLKYFAETLLKTKKPIKVLLLDQEKMAGAGNIYVVEGLFLAGIRPTRPANSLIPKEVEKLFNSIEIILNRAIKLQGSSEQAYVTLEGAEGTYHHNFLVYSREGQPCRNPACRQAGIVVQKIKLGGRGTYFCPNCQK